MVALFPEEESQQSEHSPGPVSCDEALLRAMIHPDHVRDGEVIPASISLRDLKDSGFSVDRLAHSSQEGVQTLIDGYMAKNEERLPAGVAQFECRSIRSVLAEDGARAFKVLDDGLEHNHAHAIVLSAVRRGEGGLRKLRLLLVPFLQARVSLGDVQFPSDEAA